MSQRITITLDDEIYNQLKEQAKRDYRTIGAEIGYLLRLYVPTYKTILSAPITPTPIDNTIYRRKELL